MNSEWLVLVSYIDAGTNSAFFQELLEPSCFRSTSHFLDIEQGYEIELVSEEWIEFAELPTPLTPSGDQTLSSIRLRKVTTSYQKKDIPSGGELFSLLYGSKGLAAFSMREDDDEELILDGQAFEKFLDAGVIHKRVVNLKIDGSVIKYLLFYSTDQAWRADIYEQLKRHLAESPWTRYLEQIESIVLGYFEPKL